MSMLACVHTEANRRCVRARKLLVLYRISCVVSILHLHILATKACLRSAVPQHTSAQPIVFTGFDNSFTQCAYNNVLTTFKVQAEM